MLPLSARLAGVLKMAKTDPTGKDFTADKHVFGDVVGNKIGDIKRAWATCVLKAHGHTPTNTRTKGLSPDSQKALAAIGLARPEARSR